MRGSPIATPLLAPKIFGPWRLGGGPKGKAAALHAWTSIRRLPRQIRRWRLSSLITIGLSGASEGFERAIGLNPSYATAYQRYSLYLMAMGQVQDSFAQIQKARQLDPLSISINFSLGWRLSWRASTTAPSRNFATP